MQSSHQSQGLCFRSSFCSNSVQFRLFIVFYIVFSHDIYAIKKTVKNSPHNLPNTLDNTYYNNYMIVPLSVSATEKKCSTEFKRK